MPRIPDLPVSEVDIKSVDVFPYYTVTDDTTRHASFATLFQSVSSYLVGKYADKSTVDSIDSRLQNTITQLIPTSVNASTWVLANSSNYTLWRTWLLDNSAKLAQTSTIVASGSSVWSTKDWVTEKINGITSNLTPAKTTLPTLPGISQYPITGYTSTAPENYFVVLDGLIQSPGVDYTIISPLTDTGAQIKLLPTPSRVQTLTVLAYRTTQANLSGIEGITVLRDGGTVGSYGDVTKLNVQGRGVTVSRTGATVTFDISGLDGTPKSVAIQQGGGTVVPNITCLNFSGDLLNTITYDLPAHRANITTKTQSQNTSFSGIQISDNNISKGTTFTNLNFIGANVNVVSSGSNAIVNIPCISSILLQNAGTDLGGVTAINFQGNSIVAAKDGSTAIITVNSQPSTPIPAVVTQSASWVTSTSAIKDQSSSWVVENSSKAARGWISVQTTHNTQVTGITALDFVNASIQNVTDNKATISFDTDGMVAPVVTSFSITNSAQDSKNTIYTIQGYTNNFASNYLVTVAGKFITPATDYIITSPNKIVFNPSKINTGDIVVVLAYQTSLQATNTLSLTGLTPVITQLSGNDITTVYALNGYTTNNAAGYMVILGGLVQTPSVDYYIANNSINFTSPVPDGITGVVYAYQSMPGNSLLGPDQIGALSIRGGNLAGNLNVNGDVSCSVLTTSANAIIAGSTRTGSLHCETDISTNILHATNIQSASAVVNTLAVSSLNVDHLKVLDKHFFNLTPAGGSNNNTTLDINGGLSGLRVNEVYNITFSGVTRPYDGTAKITGSSILDSQDRVLVANSDIYITWPAGSAHSMPQTVSFTIPAPPDGVVKLRLDGTQGKISGVTGFKL